MKREGERNREKRKSEKELRPAILWQAGARKVHTHYEAAFSSLNQCPHTSLLTLMTLFSEPDNASLYLLLSRLFRFWSKRQEGLLSPHSLCSSVDFTQAGLETFREKIY